MAEVRLENLSKSYGHVEVIPDINLTIKDGSFTVLVGPSGCGKSTLLRMIAGLEQVSDGYISIDNADVTHAEPSDRGIAMVFQSYALYPHMSVKQNIGFGLKLAKTPKAEIETRVQKAADILQLGPLLDRKPRQLSGGQRQRVAIGRSIVRDPKVFLFDEPLSNLDAALRTQMRVELAELHSSLDATMVYVTHDQVEAMTMADQIVIMQAGKIEQVGSPMDLYNYPASVFVAGFIGSPKMNLITGPEAERHGATTLGIRPEHIEVNPSKGAWNGTLRHIEFLGSDSYAYVTVDSVGEVTVRINGQTTLETGQRVWLSPQPDQLHFFDNQGHNMKVLIT